MCFLREASAVRQSTGIKYNENTIASVLCYYNFSEKKAGHTLYRKLKSLSGICKMLPISVIFLQCTLTKGIMVFSDTF